MACSLDTYTPNQPSNHRISFSNDFAEAHPPMGPHTGRPISEAQSSPPSLDFEFSVSGYKMISADELFFKGQLVPQRPNTPKEELLLGDNDVFSFGLQKSSNKWKEIFGLKKTPSSPKKIDKGEKGPLFILENKAQVSSILHVR